MINSSTGMINDDTGMIENSAQLINDNIRMITETCTEYTASGRRKRSKERGEDSKPRNFPLQTSNNLPQFRDKPHQEVREYILEKNGVDIGSNVNAVDVTIIVIVVLMAITSPLWIGKLTDWHNKRKERKKMN